MKNNFSKIIFLTATAFLLLSCTNNSEKERKTVNYQIGFPKEFSPALNDFLIYYSVPMYTSAFSIEDMYVFSQFDVKEMPEEIIYFTHSNEQITTYFAPLLDAKDTKNTFSELTDNFEIDMLQSKEDKLVYTYPEAVLDDDNTISLRTTEGKKSFNLPKILSEFDVKPDNDLVISIPAANEDSFYLKIKNVQSKGANQYIFVFMNQDFTNITAISGDSDLFNESINKGELDDFRHLIFETELNNRYTVTVEKNRIFDNEDKVIHRIDKNAGFPSRNGKFIFLKGSDSPLEEGNHRIQRTEDFLDDNDQYFAEFELDYKEIANELDLDSAGIGISDIIYFDENYVVLFLQFNAPITGTAGSTNVIIDFQEDKDNPTYYLVDLGIH